MVADKYAAIDTTQK